MGFKKKMEKSSYKFYIYRFLEKIIKQKFLKRYKKCVLWFQKKFFKKSLENNLKIPRL